MSRSTIIKMIAWLPITFGVGLVLASPAGAGPFNGSQSHRAEARPDIVLVDHRSRKGHGWRGHRGGYRQRTVAVPARRRYRDMYVVRRHGHRYHGYGYHNHDAEAYHWLAFTAITVKLLDMVTESQQREHESAQIRASTAPIGETINWNEDGARGSVTAVREGTSSAGRYCREFQQTLIVGGKTENAYGTACRQPDGSWELIP